MKGIAIKYGLLMAFGFVVYFLIMRALGLSENYYFRLFNGVIHVALIGIAIKKYKDFYPLEFNYLSGVTIGVISSLLGVIPFAIFMLVFLSNTPDFMLAIQDQAQGMAEYLTPYTAALIIFLEGVAVSFVASYILMRIVDSYK